MLKYLHMMMMIIIIIHDDDDDDSHNYEKNSKFKSTYLGEFLMDFKNFDIFEQEIISSRA